MMKKISFEIQKYFTRKNVGKNYIEVFKVSYDPDNQVLLISEWIMGLMELN